MGVLRGTHRLVSLTDNKFTVDKLEKDIYI